MGGVLDDFDSTVHFDNMMEAPGWQDQGCLPHTNRSLSGRVVHWGNQASR